MTRTEFQLQVLRDPRLAIHATSAHPVWLWSADGVHVVWANPVAARLFGMANSAEFATKTFGPADTHRRQVGQLANRLPLSGATRLERLRGFGAQPGMLMTCGCARLAFPDGSHGILITAVETVMRGMNLTERLQLLAAGQKMPIATFDRKGTLMGASDAAGSFLNLLSDTEVEQACSDALERGRAELPISIGNLVFQRVGSGTDVGLVALVVPHVVEEPPVPEAQPDVAAAEQLVAPAAELPLPSYEQPALSNEAPAEFALIDEFAEPLDDEGEAPATEAPASQPAPIEAELIDNSAGKPSQDSPSTRRRHPLRFTWQMDAGGYFSLGSNEFTWLIGARTAAGFGRLWREIAEGFGLDPKERLREAIATRETWSGITMYWPVDGGGRLPVELSGVPIFDENRAFSGYRGFGVCRDLDSLEHLAELRRQEPAGEATEAAALSPAAETVPVESGHEAAPHPPAAVDMIGATPLGPSASIADEIAPPADSDERVATPHNVVPFRPVGEPKSSTLSPVENHAFNEIARQLSARLDSNSSATPGAAVTNEAKAQPSERSEAGLPREQTPAAEWLAPPEPPARGQTRRDRALLDLLPTGILIYRLDRLLYANAAFLQRVGYESLHALEQAGGLDALYVEAGVSQASSTSEAGMPMTISAGEGQPATDARLFTISWDDESALALMFAPARGAPQADAAAAPRAAAPAPPPAGAAVGQADAEDLAAILDTTAEGVVMFDAAGTIHACNRSAEALFGYDGEDLLRRGLADMFAPESQRAVVEYLEAVKGTGVASLLDHGREVLGRVAKGGIIPLSMTMGRTRPDGPNFFAVFLDLSQGRKGESELQQARRTTDRAANAKADMLARISHEVRTPLNTIIGFAEVMIGERFGALGSERYVEYMRDIRASGERVTTIIDDLTELSRIETGRLELAFANQNLNELVESCVATMQPQANRERIIIRTSLAHSLPPVVADARALRQITLNLIGNSIHLANPAGQVIVSTALSDFGEVVLRVRDTGPGLNDNEVAAALEPFRTSPPSDESSPASPVSLSLTKALVEANRAQFNLKTSPQSGTLVEVVFSRALARN